MNRFTNTVLRDVPGCPDPLIEEEILSAAIEFCKRAQIYTTSISESITSGDESVTITAPDNTSVVEVDHIEIDDIKYYEIEHDEGVISFDKAATQDYDMIISVSLKPLMSATALPNILYNDWYQTIAAGAKAKLMIMPEKPWSNPNLAAVQSGIFEDGVHEAMKKAFRRSMPTEKRVERRQWL